MNKLFIIYYIYYLNVILMHADVNPRFLHTYITLSGKNVNETH